MEDWYAKWAKYHAAMFGMDRDADAQTFAVWRSLFIKAGFTADELHEATDWLALNAKPSWRNEHLAGIMTRIRDRRAEARQQRPADSGVSYPACQWCLGSGYVSVPDLRTVHDGEWNGRGTCAVLCRCGWGQREQQRLSELEAKKIPMWLDTYERHNPGWIDQQERYWNLRKAARDARTHTEFADKTLGPIMARIRKMKAEPEPEPAAVDNGSGEVEWAEGEIPF